MEEMTVVEVERLLSENIIVWDLETVPDLRGVRSR